MNITENFDCDPRDERKLQAIRAKCVELLDIASKRTPGEWKFTYEGIYNRGASFPDIIDPGEFAASDAEVSIENAAFIASCAGPAEAGWKATIAAIDLVEQTCRREYGSDYTPLAEAALKDILTAWEGIV